MSVAQNIIEIVKEHIPKEAGEKVKRIRLKIGELSGVVPDSLTFCFDILKNGSTLQNAVIEIEYILITAQCRSCSETSKLEYGIFLCPKCYSSDNLLLTGNELNIVEIELED